MQQEDKAQENPLKHTDELMYSYRGLTDIWERWQPGGHVHSINFEFFQFVRQQSEKVKTEIKQLFLNNGSPDKMKVLLNEITQTIQHNIDVYKRREEEFLNSNPEKHIETAKRRLRIKRERREQLLRELDENPSDDMELKDLETAIGTLEAELEELYKEEGKIKALAGLNSYKIIYEHSLIEMTFLNTYTGASNTTPTQTVSFDEIPELREVFNEAREKVLYIVYSGIYELLIERHKEKMRVAQIIEQLTGAKYKYVQQLLIQPDYRHGMKTKGTLFDNIEILGRVLNVLRDPNLNGQKLAQLETAYVDLLRSKE